MEGMGSLGFIDAVSDDVHGENLALLVSGSNVSVDVTAEFAPIPTVRTVESWILPAGIQQMSAEAILPLKGAIASRTGMIPGDELERSNLMRRVASVP